MSISNNYIPEKINDFNTYLELLTKSLFPQIMLQ